MSQFEDEQKDPQKANTVILGSQKIRYRLLWHEVNHNGVPESVLP